MLQNDSIPVMAGQVPSCFLDLLSIFQPFHLCIRIGHLDLQLDLVSLFNLVGRVQLFEKCCKKIKKNKTGFYCKKSLTSPQGYMYHHLQSLVTGGKRLLLQGSAQNFSHEGQIKALLRYWRVTWVSFINKCLERQVYIGRIYKYFIRTL